MSGLPDIFFMKNFKIWSENLENFIELFLIYSKIYIYIIINNII